MPNQAKAALKNLDVEYISLVNAGANLKTLVYKTADARREMADGASTPLSNREAIQSSLEIRKVDTEKRLVYCIVYAPDEVDSQGHTMSAVEIEKASQRFMKAARTNQIDKQHNENPDQGFVAENWIVRKGDELFNEIGAWAVAIKVADDETWQQVKDGKITGVSMQGLAIAEPIEAEVEAEEKSLFKKFMNVFLKQFQPGGEVSKDFAGRMLQRQLYQAIYALEDEVRSLLDNDELDTFNARKQRFRVL